MGKHIVQKKLGGSKMTEIWLTSEEIKKREERLEYLKGPRRLEIAEMLKVARAFGDLSENAEYDAAKNEQAKNEYDIIQLENELKNAKVIDDSNIDTRTVGVGTTVELVNQTSGMEMTFRIVGSAETDPTAGKISNDSPVGRALLGHGIGETVEVQTPGGAMRFCIRAIRK